STHGLAVLLPCCRADVKCCNGPFDVPRFQVRQQFAPIHVRREVGDGRHKSGANARLQLCDELSEQAGLGSGCHNYAALLAALIRFSAIAKYSGSSSIPMNLRLRLTAATPVVPDPMQLSRTVSPGFVDARISLSISATGFCVG